MPQLRAMSPAPGGSSLITCAPKSASVVEQNGPAGAWVRSSTLTFSSGSCIAVMSRDEGRYPTSLSFPVSALPRCLFLHTSGVGKLHRAQAESRGGHATHGDDCGYGLEHLPFGHAAV